MICYIWLLILLCYFVCKWQALTIVYNIYIYVYIV